MSSVKSLILKNKKRNLLNKMKKTSVKNLIKKFLIEVNKNSSNVEFLFTEIQSKIMKAVSKRVFTKNYASRKISALYKKLNKSKDSVSIPIPQER